MTKMRLAMITASSGVLVCLYIFFFILPPALDRRMNSVFSGPAGQYSPETSNFHRQLFVVDLHADTLLWNRPILEKSSRGHVDLPRLKLGHIALETFSVVTKTPLIPNVTKNNASDAGTFILGVAQRWPLKTWGSMRQRALYQAGKLKDAVAASRGQLRLILSRGDLATFRKDWEKDPELTAAWLTIEGGPALEGDLAQLDTLFHEGFRMIGPAHLFDTDLAGSQSGDQKYGLTSLGKEWVTEMDRRKMIIDLAHISPVAFEEVLALSKRPQLVSHTGVQAVCGIQRNLTDEQIVKVAKKGGIIGIGLWAEAMCGSDLIRVAQTMKHVCRLVGCRHVALGSDWDGFVSTAVDSENIGLLTRMLKDQGLSDSDIRLIMGESAFEFLSENLP